MSNKSNKSNKHITKQNTKQITGAGVIPVEYYKNKQNRKSIAVILFYDNGKKMYTDAGGSRDTKNSVHESIKNTAIRELREESCNLFVINKSVLKSYVRLKEYVGFFIAVNGPVHSKYYYDNLNILHKNNAPRYWKETSNITRVYVQDLIKSGILDNKEIKNTKIYDANNNIITINKRAIGLIKHALLKDLFNSLEINDTHIHKNSSSYLKDTVSYVL